MGGRGFIAMRSLFCRFVFCVHGVFSCVHGVFSCVHGVFSCVHGVWSYVGTVVDMSSKCTVSVYTVLMNTI